MQPRTESVGTHLHSFQPYRAVRGDGSTQSFFLFICLEVPVFSKYITYVPTTYVVPR